MIKLIFLDRDGVINIDSGYISSINEFKVIPNVLESLLYFSQKGYRVVIISNQSGVARGFIKEKKLIEINNYFISLVNNFFLINKSSNPIDYSLYCPHFPSGLISEFSITCECRKPKPGMINNAISEYRKKNLNCNLEQSFIIGDKEIDIETGLNAGIKNTVLISSKFVKSSKAKFQFNSLYDFTLANLL